MHGQHRLPVQACVLADLHDRLCVSVVLGGGVTRYLVYPMPELAQPPGSDVPIQFGADDAYVFRLGGGNETVVVGGYLVPVIAGRESGFPLGLDLYLLVLNLGAFYVSRKCLWSALDFLASMLAVLMCFFWSASHPNSGGQSAVLVNLAFLSVVHALYMTGVIVGAKARGKVGNAVAWAGLCVNAVAYFAWLAAVFRESFSSRYAGLILLGLVAAYLAVATLAIRRGWADRATVNILLVFALAFLAISPVLLFGKAWWAVSWAAIAVAASEAEIRSEQKILGILSWVILIVASFATLFHFAPLAYCQRSVSQLTQLSGGEYFSEFALRLVRLWSLPAAAAFIAYRRRVGPIAIAALAVTFIFFTGEARIFGYAFLPALKTGTVSVAWLLHGALASWRLGREGAPYGHCTSRDPRSRRLVRARRRPPHRRSIPLHEVQGKV